MQLGAYEIAIIGVGGAVVGALISAWATYRLTLSYSEIMRRQTAYENFRKSFATVVTELGRTDRHRVEIIVSEFPTHEIAFFNFTSSLSISATNSLKSKWEEYEKYYRKYYENRNDLNLVDFLLKEEDTQERKKLVNLIYEILEVAKQN